MKDTAVFFYSFGAKTREIAQNVADKRGAVLFEIKETKKRSMPGAFFRGCPAAMGGKCSEIQRPDTDMEQYETIVLMAPVWAGHPAPAFNSMVQLLPRGKKVCVILTSGSGSDKAEPRIRGAIAVRGCELVEYRNIKTAQ